MQSNDGAQAGSEADPTEASDSKYEGSPDDSNIQFQMYSVPDARSISSMSSRGDYEAIVAADRAELTRVASESKVNYKDHGPTEPRHN